MARRASSEDKQQSNPDAIAGCFTEYSSMMADMGRLSQRIGTMFARYEKSDGVDAKAVKHSYTMAGKDPAEARRRHELNDAYLRITGVIRVDEATGQTEVSDEVMPRVPMPSREMQAQVAAARAFGDGYNSGKHGATIDSCPHAVGSETFVRWRDGWEDGHADRIERKPELANVTQAEPRRRGRPPGSKNKAKDNGTDEQAAAPNGQTDIEEQIDAAASIH